VLWCTPVQYIQGCKKKTDGPPYFTFKAVYINNFLQKKKFKLKKNQMWGFESNVRFCGPLYCRKLYDTNKSKQTSARLGWTNQINQASTSHDIGRFASKKMSFSAKEPYNEWLFFFLRKIDLQPKASYGSSSPCTLHRLWFAARMSTCVCATRYNTQSHDSVSRQCTLRHTLQHLATPCNIVVCVWAIYRAAKTRRMPYVTGHFSQNSHSL